MELAGEHHRYMVLGSMNGLLGILGFIIGASASGNNEFLIKAALAGAVALSLTNGAGSYVVQSALESGRLSNLEKPLLRSLEDTRIEELTRRKVLKDSLAHGCSCLLGSLVPISPFLVLESQQLEVSMDLSFIALGALGIYSGKTAKQNILLHMILMIGLGVTVVFVIKLLGLGP